MNFEWITSPLAIYAVLALGGAAALHLVVSTRIEMRRQQKRHRRRLGYRRWIARRRRQRCQGARCRRDAAKQPVGLPVQTSREEQALARVFGRES